MAVGEHVARLHERLDELPLLVTNPVNLRYLIGFQSSNAALLVAPDRLTLFSDFRYAEAARALAGVEFVETKRALLRDLAARLEGRVGFEATHVTFDGWSSLNEGPAELVPTAGVVEELRAVKDERELSAIRRAAEIADDAFRALLDERWVGRTDRELAFRLEQLMHERGAEAASFETIVAPGARGALPHGRPNGSKVGAETLVVVDWGCVVEGYCSDCTRTVATGALSDELREMYEVCLEAQQRAVEGARAGLTGIEADALARQVIDDAGHGERFGHGLGHGVGLAVHEAPRLSTESSDTLVPGNVVTVEPGIYAAGLAGVRIEDLAVVTENGLDVYTAVPKELLTVS